jgi:hypothetical protein
LTTLDIRGYDLQELSTLIGEAGMGVRIRKALCCALAVCATLPASLLGGEPNTAMLYARGATWVNGAAVLRTSALFPGDLVQTKSNSAANIHLPGSIVTVLPDSLAKFEGPTLELQHGGIVILSSKQLATHIGDVTVVAAKPELTEFWAGSTDASVTIMARTGDVTIIDDSGSTTLSAGQETTREESKKKNKRKGAAPAATGSIMDSKAALIAGIAAVGGITTLVLLQREDPISPDRMGR